MAVKIMQQNYVFLQKLGVSPSHIAKLVDNKVVLHLGFKDVKLVNAGGYVLSHIQFPISVAALMKPDCAEATKAVVATQIAKAIGVVDFANTIQPQPGDTVPSPGASEPVLTNVGAKPYWVGNKAAPTPAPKYTSIKDVPPKPVHTSAQPMSAVLAMAPVKLTVADRMYQPVWGTSKGTKYYTVALGPDAAVAVRFAGLNVSIRAERMSVKARKAFKDLGFSDQPDYMSVHLKAVKTTPIRLVGAVLLATGLDWETPMPKLSVLPC